MVLRGTALRDAAILRVLAVERGIRGVLLVLLAYGVYAFNGSRNSLRQVFDEYLPLLRPVADRLGIDLESAGPVRLIEKALNAQHSTLLMVAAGVLAYGVLELVEAVGLWMMKRWGEYVAVVGTRHLHPARGLRARGDVTWVRVVALALNVFAVVYLLWTKRLFGIRGGKAAFEGERESVSLLEVERAALARSGREPRRPGSDRQPAAAQLRAQPTSPAEPDRVESGGPAAAATLSAESSTNTQLSSGRPIRSRSTSKIAGSGLARASAPETTMSSNRPRKSKRASACGNSSSDQLVSAKTRYAGRVQVAQHATLASIAPTMLSAKCVAVGSTWSRPVRVAARDRAALGPDRRPASSRWFQARKSKSSAARNRAASSSPTPAAIAGCGSQPDQHVAEVEHHGRGAVAHFQRSEAGTKSRRRSPV